MIKNVRYSEECCILKYLIVFILFFILSFSGFSQNSEVRLYNPDADANAELERAILIAKQDQKHVLVQVGGNWCSWCIKLDRLLSNDRQIDSLLRADYIPLRVNFSKENRNLPILARLEYPQRFGFPVLIVLDAYGHRLHTQDTGLLEEGKQHSPEKVLNFLRNWSPKALDPLRNSEQ